MRCVGELIEKSEALNRMCAVECTEVELKRLRVAADVENAVEARRQL